MRYCRISVLPCNTLTAASKGLDLPALYTQIAHGSGRSHCKHLSVTIQQMLQGNFCRASRLLPEEVGEKQLSPPLHNFKASQTGQIHGQIAPLPG